MFTIDLEGDWGGSETRAIEEVLPPFLDLLTRYSVKVTFFAVAELVKHYRSYLSPNGPHEIASHSLTHPFLTRLSEDEVKFELAESKRILEHEGYHISGFRAPYFAAPARLSTLLAEAGYEYDASFGTVYPFPTQRKIKSRSSTLPSLPTTTLKDGLTPFSLTYLRLYHPWGLRLISPRANLFYCHLHELLEKSQGWLKLPSPLRRLHLRNSGEVAWQIVEQLLHQYGSRLSTCRDYLKERERHNGREFSK